MTTPRLVRPQMPATHRERRWNGDTGRSLEGTGSSVARHRGLRLGKWIRAGVAGLRLEGSVPPGVAPRSQSNETSGGMDQAWKKHQWHVFFHARTPP